MGTDTPQDPFRRLNKLEVAKKLGISPRTLERLSKHPDFPRRIQPSRQAVWFEAAIERWVEAQLQAQIQAIDQRRRPPEAADDRSTTPENKKNSQRPASPAADGLPPAVSADGFHLPEAILKAYQERRRGASD